MVPLINHPVPILQSSHVLMRSCPRVSWCSTLTLTPDRGRVSPQPHYMAWGATAHVIGAITAALTAFATLRDLQFLYTPPWPGIGLLLLLLLLLSLYPPLEMVNFTPVGQKKWEMSLKARLIWGQLSIGVTHSRSFLSRVSLLWARLG